MRRIVLLLFVVLWACGGPPAGTTQGDGAAVTTTTGADVATTTIPAATTTTEGETVAFGDIPQECLDLFADYLRTVEPIVQDVSWDEVQATELEALMAPLEEPTKAFDTQAQESGCDEVNVEGNTEGDTEAMLAFAQAEAPGTVGYLNFIFSFAGLGGENQVSGDCETDIAAVQAVVDQGKKVSELSMVELGPVTALLAAIQTECAPARFEEFFSKPDVQEFLNN